MESRSGCGPLIAPLNDTMRPLRQQIFERVRAAGLIPRVEVAKALGISPASVTTLTSELIDQGLLEEVAAPRATSDSGRGRPPVALGVRPEAHYVAGIKLSDREHTAVIVDFAGNVIASEAIAMVANSKSVEDLLDTCETLIDLVTEKSGVARTRLSSIGIGVPGFVEGRSGRVIWSPLLANKMVDLAPQARERFDLPVTIDNDANLVALAELWFGAGRELSDFAVITIEHGVGMGYVMNHRLFRGAEGLGTELGHVKVQLDGALCRCGQRGCLEAYIADYALAREAATALDQSAADIQGTAALLEHLHEEAKKGNKAAKSIFNRAGRYLAVGLANVVNLFDPSKIFLSGGRMRYDFLYANDVLAEMDTLVLNTRHDVTAVEVHSWGDLLWARGAAALALSSLTETCLNGGVETGTA